MPRTAPMPRARPPSPRRAATRARILAAAEQVFARVGVAEATVADLLEAAGVSRRTFYQHFPGKLEVLLSLGRQGLARDQVALRGRLEAGADPVALVRESLHKDAAWFEAHPSLAAPLIHTALQGPLVPPPEDEGSHRALFTELVGAAQATGQLRRDVPASELALLLAGALGHAVLAWSAAPGPPLKARLDRLLDVVLDGARG